MRKMMLCGRSEVGKTTLTQALKGEEIFYTKSQYTNTWDITIDTPGEYYETKAMTMKALYCFSFDCDLEGLVVAADEPYSVLVPGLHTALQRPLIGIITKIHAPNANIPMVRQWLLESGCERIFLVDSVTGEGVDELRNFLLEPKQKKMSLTEAIHRQACGIREW